VGRAILPVVEGQSEVLAVGPLLRRLLERIEVYDVTVARPFRVHRNRVVRKDELERTLRHALSVREGVNAALVLLDADDDCPAELGPELLRRTAGIATHPVRVVMPKVEIEAWVLAGVESLRGHRGISMDAECPADPEAIRDAKGAISDRMNAARGYVATDDLPAFFATLDLDLALRRSPSLAKLERDLRGLVTESIQASGGS
jgi:hypothetical protein